MKKTLLLTSAVLLAFAGSASAQVILYQDSFTGGSPSTPAGLNGSTPTTDNLDINGNLLLPSGTAATWLADGAWATNGSSATVSTSAASNAFLPFTPTLGDDYTLSATLSTSGLDWLALGFTSATSGTNFFYNNPGAPNPAPWMLLGTGSTPGVGVYSSGLTQAASGTAFQGDTFTFALNTFVNPATPWTYSLTATGPGITGTLTLISNGTYATNPTINYVGMGAAVANGTVTDFTLTDTSVAAPEPSTYMFLGLGGLALLLVGRRTSKLA